MMKWRVLYDFFALVFIVLLVFSGAKAFADIGVGVGTGKIEINELIQAGGIYRLPPVIVYNTGDETATYTMHVTNNEVQDELKPDPAWFSFEPSSFEIEPGKSELVTPVFRPPLTIEAGKYHGYLEAYPDTTIDQGGASIGVAAATKLYFDVEASNSIHSILNRLKALFEHYTPWTYIATALILLTIVWVILRRFLRINIQITTASKNKKTKKGGANQYNDEDE